jgi:trehalose-6-phosphate synthase
MLILSVGYSTDKMDSDQKNILKSKLRETQSSVPVFLSDTDLEGHYDKFCKQVSKYYVFYLLDTVSSMI